MRLPPPEPERCVRLMREAIEAFQLDLAGVTVLTEAASGPFVVTPLIAALAGAETVLALTAPSRHASVQEVTALTERYAARYEVAAAIAMITGRDDARMADVDLATNLGFVRPLDRPLLQRLGPDAAVALMCEPWEVRAGDVDLEACRELGIPALGTNEDDGRLRMFDYLPVLARKLLGELDVELAGTRLVLISAGRFATALERGLESMGAEVASFTPAGAGTDTASFPSTGGSDGGAPPPPAGARARDAAARSFTDAGFETAVRDAAAVVIADYPGCGPIVGPDAPYSARELRSWNPALVLVHIAGDVVLDDHERSRIRHAPEHFAPAGTMSVTAAELGARPVVNLHCAGLRVGAELCRARRRGLDAPAAEREVLATLPLALGPATTEGATA